MGSRLELQSLLENLIDSNNVYYNPPGGLIINTTAILYEPSKINLIHANNAPYQVIPGYSITVVSPLPNDETVAKLLRLPLCSFDRHYISDGLNHDVLLLYY